MIDLLRKEMTRNSKRSVMYSVVVPVFNEAGNIEDLDKEIKEVMSKLGSYEIIYINDGSKDRSLDELKKLKEVTIVNLNRNYGQSVALDAGFKVAQGDMVISLDGDGQNDPADIPRMIEKLGRENLDVIAGWRRERKDKQGIKILSRMGRNFRRLLIHDTVHDAGCTLRIYKREAVKSLELQGEMHRYILALLRWKGFKIGELPVHHRARRNGKSKYGYKKAVKGFIDLIHIWFIDKYSQRPLHMFGFLGLVSILLGLIIEGWMIYEKLFREIDLSANAWFILGFFLLITGILLFSFGLVLDTTIKIYLNTSPFEKRYYVKEVLEK